MECSTSAPLVKHYDSRRLADITLLYNCVAIIRFTLRSMELTVSRTYEVST